MTRTFDAAPDGLLRYKVQYTIRDDAGNLQGAGRALIERFNTKEAAEQAAAALNGRTQ